MTNQNIPRGPQNHRRVSWVPAYSLFRVFLWSQVWSPIRRSRSALKKPLKKGSRELTIPKRSQRIARYTVYVFCVRVSRVKKTLPLVKYLRKIHQSDMTVENCQTTKRQHFAGPFWESNGDTIFVDILLADFGHRVPQWSHGFFCWSSERSGFSKFTGF